MTDTVFLVPCPYCGADPGDPCRHLGEMWGQLGYVHAERSRAAGQYLDRHER